MFPVNKILRVVFDTNVLAAALRSKRGASFQLLSMLPSPKFQLAVSVPLYLEYLDVLMRPEVKPGEISNADVLGFIRKTLDFPEPINRPRLRPNMPSELRSALLSRCAFLVSRRFS